MGAHRMAPRHRRLLTRAALAAPTPAARPEPSPVSLRRLLHDLLCTLGVRTDPGTWVLPDRVLACAYPRTQAALAALAIARITTVVNLHPRRHDPIALAALGIREAHLPTPDFTAPPLTVLRRGVAVIESAILRGERVAVHCGSGRGRTGTLIACLLVARGESPAESITRVRRMRPGSVETHAQEEAVHHFDWSLTDG